MLSGSESRDSFDNYRSVVAWAAIFVLLFLSFQAYSAFRIKLAEKNNSGTNFNIGNEYFFSQSILYNIDRLEREKELLRLSQPLEYMVWPEERKKLSRQLQILLREQINDYPFDYKLWRKLSFVQVDSGATHQDQAWVLLKAIKLGGWNTAEKTLLARHCVVHFDSLEKIIPNQCRELISSLSSSKNLHYYSKRMGVTQHYLKWMLEKNNIVLSGSNYE